MLKYLFSFLVVLFTTISNAQTLNYYFGNIHAHSGYSDGNKDSVTSGMSTPIEDFLYARNSQHIDFYGISEHNHYNAGLTNPANYHQGLADAQLATNDTFVALYGMEWGVIDNGGHVIVYGYDSLIGWDANNYDVFNDEYNYAGLFAKINQKQNAFAYLAHPAVTDYNFLFTTAVNLNADNAIVGMAARSGPAFSTNFAYSNPATSNYISRYNDALKQGYHLGVGLDHDTHNSVFGRQTKGRLVVMSDTLSRPKILDAMRRMRFYSSDDWNCKVQFTVNNNVMGSVITQTGNPTLSVIVADDDNENITSIAVYSGIPGSGSAPTVLTSTSNTFTLNYTHSITNNASYYYYLKITQADGDIIWTSPIWYKRNDNLTNTPPVAAFTPSATALCINQLITFTDNTTNGPTSWAWSLPGALPDTSNTQSVVASYPLPGTYTVYLTATNAFGASTTTPITITVSTVPNVTAQSVTICTGQIATLVANGATTYSWNIGVTNDTLTVSPTISTSYTVTGTVNGCSKTITASVTVLQCTGVDETAAMPVTIYPNPAGNYVMVDAGDLAGKKRVEVVDILGRKLLSQTSTDRLIAIDLTSLSSGSYIVNITTATKNISHSIVVNR